jgi:hypothetical protein
MDEDTDTPDNVIVYSDVAKNKIKSIDGYNIVPTRQKEAKRAYYDRFPSLMNDKL